MVTTTTALALTVATLLAFTAIGIWFSRGRVDSVEDLISARGSAGEGRTTATLVASVMGVWILLSAPEAGASFGIAAVVGYGVGEALPMLAFSRIGPRVREVMPEGHSLTEYAYVRYGRAAYAFVLLVSVAYMFVFVAAELTGIALALSLVADVPQWQTAVLVGGAVLLYTSYGGLRASIVTDSIQALLVLPLLVLALAWSVVTLGGADAIYGGIVAMDPSLLDPTAPAGLRFGVALALAVLGAELVNQTWWQRLYAGRDADTVARGFRNATLANGLVVFVAALFGLVAVGGSEVANPSVAFFSLVGSTFPEWVVLGVVLLALLLVTSSVDSLFNAISSVVTADLPRLLDDPSDRSLTAGARGLTVLVAVAAIYVSLEARSVLELFLFADLLGAAVAGPLVYGLYSPRLTGRGALLASVAGLVVGGAYFPFPLGIGGGLRSLPVLGAILPAPDGLYLTAFAGAFLVSCGVAVAFAWVTPGTFDFDRLSRDVGRLDRRSDREDAPADGGGDDQEVAG